MNDRKQVPADNLTLWRQQAAENRELRHLQIAAIAREVAASENGAESPYNVPELPVTVATDSFSAALAVDEKLAFCREVLSERPDFVAMGETSPPPPACPRVARLAGEIFSRAAHAFSPVLPLTAPLYLSTLTELLEETAGDGADFAILPIEDANGNRFLHFYEDFDRMDLHICHTCDISPDEAGRLSRFALISKRYRPAAPTKAQPMIECQAPEGSRKTFSTLLTVANAAGLLLRRSDALPASYAEDVFIHYPVFIAPGGTALLDAYLRLFLPDAVVTGRYFHLK